MVVGVASGKGASRDKRERGKVWVGRKSILESARLWFLADPQLLFENSGSCDSRVSSWMKLEVRTIRGEESN